MMNVERMSATFDEARFSDGLPQAEVNATIRRVYENGEHDVAPIAVTRARMLACALENVRLAVGRNDTFAGVVERHYLDSRYGVGEIARIQGERAEAVARRDFPEGFARTNSAWAEGRFFTQADLSHTSPDWERILSLGIPGLLAGPGALTATGGSLPGGPDTIGTMTVSDGATLVGDVALDFAADGTCDQIVFAPGGTYDVSGIRLVPSASGESAWKAAKCFVFGSAADAELTGDFYLSAISGARIKHLDNGNLELSVPGAFVVIVR